ncbi:SDR family NAD(P)-dependent oxidoreductase [Nonomuraea gerenzanensis]|uniref:Dehydrogenases with different specificities (Related to short-chain alcohol dehydrogenases) n=1 Tax=Nonomuraea gerenzanensis TaxID=93944 RepID=A0A1M4ERD8_9ACTN|nr:SDR family NAD(P)-dependent oxidoreductase [Nonomuraea gerenzanensis]UBU12628.1 SDR family NAD(P)-dependent oxidoreductase [Nonomuraea gerenzanensis]SBP01183.1 Dehydrogenases with different specificities (related to short-chain alcohol dehydrogenases) [Nonomuraea gerenzanensis]
MGVLEGKVAVVTGASRGIGAAIAVRLAAEGAQVVVAARTVEAAQSRLEGTLGDTVAQIEAAGGTAFAQATDLSREQDRRALVEAAEQRYGAVDILVNNAAVTYFAQVRDFSDRRYQLMFEVQVNAPFHLARLVIPGMRERGAGWILNISSIAARHPTFPPGAYAGFGGTVYGMCKAALERFTTGLAAELYADDIAVNALSPNQVVPTPGTLFHRLTTDDDPDAEPPSVMADAALALCHRPAAELTGRIAYSQDLLAELKDG